VRVLYLYCHPLPESFHAAVRVRALNGLAQGGHEVDLLDLYAEKFEPVLTAEGRRNYHDVSINRAGIETYVERLLRAEGIVVQFPVWTFGPPAMLKGFFDRLMMPGVAFDLSDPAKVKPMLENLRRIAGVTTYGRGRLRAIAVGDPPRKIVTRYLPWFAARRARVDYYALYNMNTASDADRAAFMAKVEAAMARF
jgi:putative NADPH-quinone reductase